MQALQTAIGQALQSVRGATFTFTPDADSLHVANYMKEYSRESAGELEDATDARLDQLALRLAMVFAIADATPTINVDHVAAAWEVAEYSRQVSRVITHQLEPNSMGDAEEKVRRAIRHFAPNVGDEFKRRDVNQRVKGKRGMDAETFARTLDALERAGEIEREGESSYRVVIA